MRGAIDGSAVDVEVLVRVAVVVHKVGRAIDPPARAGVVVVVAGHVARKPDASGQRRLAGRLAVGERAVHGAVRALDRAVILNVPGVGVGAQRGCRRGCRRRRVSVVQDAQVVGPLVPIARLRVGRVILAVVIRRVTGALPGAVTFFGIARRVVLAVPLVHLGAGPPVEHAGREWRQGRRDVHARWRRAPVDVARPAALRPVVILEEARGARGTTARRAGPTPTSALLPNIW